MENTAKVIPNKWHAVGVALGINQARIDAIDSQHRGRPDKCFAEVFVQWQKLHDSRQPVSWTTIVSMLKSRQVGEERLANEIQQQFM